jgi:hypothetical protein
VRSNKSEREDVFDFGGTHVLAVSGGIDGCQLQLCHAAGYLPQNWRHAASESHTCKNLAKETPVALNAVERARICSVKR